MYVCNCNEMHVVPQELDEQMIDGKEIRLICAAGCGFDIIVGLDETIPLKEGEKAYAVYSFDTVDEKNNPQRIKDAIVVYSKGKDGV